MIMDPGFRGAVKLFPISGWPAVHSVIRYSPKHSARTAWCVTKSGSPAGGLNESPGFLTRSLGRCVARFETAMATGAKKKPVQTSGRCRAPPANSRPLALACVRASVSVPDRAKNKGKTPVKDPC